MRQVFVVLFASLYMTSLFLDAYIPYPAQPDIAAIRGEQVRPQSTGGLYMLRSMVYILVMSTIGLFVFNNGKAYCDDASRAV